jgi:hypothetical protein
MALILYWPCEIPMRINQNFNVNRESYIRFNLPGHEGIDLYAPHGSKIFAAAPGVVRVVNMNGKPGYLSGAYGNHVRVEHIVTEVDGTVSVYETAYAHFHETLVEVGQEVKAGDTLGFADNTGNSTGSHLHLTLKKRGASARRETIFGTEGWGGKDIIDPTPFLRFEHAPIDAASAVTIETQRGTVKVPLQVRTAAGTNYPKVGLLSPGTMVIATLDAKDTPAYNWRKVLSPVSGWAAARELKGDKKVYIEF